MLSFNLQKQRIVLSKRSELRKWLLMAKIYWYSCVIVVELRTKSLFLLYSLKIWPLKHLSLISESSFQEKVYPNCIFLSMLINDLKALLMWSLKSLVIFKKLLIWGQEKYLEESFKSWDLTGKSHNLINTQKKDNKGLQRVIENPEIKRKEKEIQVIMEKTPQKETTVTSLTYLNDYYELFLSIRVIEQLFLILWFVLCNDWEAFVIIISK